MYQAPPQKSVGVSPCSRSHAPSRRTRSPGSPPVGRACVGLVKCVWWPNGPRVAASRARASQVPSSRSPAAASGGRISAAIASPPAGAPAAPRTRARRRRRAVVRRGTRPLRTVRSTWAAPGSSTGVSNIGNAYHAQPLLVIGAAALPRLLALAIERDDILEEYVEKSDTFARTLVASGTFGFLPEVPSAYTQPLYAWFLAALYWPLERSWVVVGLAQVALAVATALLVLPIGTRLASVRIGVLAALVATLHPYVVWHDVHVNREILDGLLAAAVVLLALAAYDRRSPLYALATGAAAGLAILSNARLSSCRWCSRPTSPGVSGPPGGRSLPVPSSFSARRSWTAPWLVRNEVVIGCPTITTDTRALWKANNPATYDVLARGGWIDDVPDLPGVPPWPERAAGISVAAAKAVDECAQSSFYRDEVLEFWRDEPGEKRRLAVQAVGMLWSPVLSVEADEPGSRGSPDSRSAPSSPPSWSCSTRSRSGAPSSRRGASSRSRRCCSVSTPHGDGVRRNRPLPRALGLRARLARGIRARSHLAVSPRRGARRRRRARRVELLDPIGAALL